MHLQETMHKWDFILVSIKVKNSRNQNKVLQQQQQHLPVWSRLRGV